jgi:small subunit ribosomal protein S9
VIGGKTYFWGTGRRKKSVARVRITAGDGKFLVNDREVDDYFKETKDRHYVRSPLITANIAGNLNIIVNVQGGGYTGQAGALVQGLGRALSLFDPGLRPAQKEGGFLTRDSRMKERKKYGQRGARRRFQFSKR